MRYIAAVLLALCLLLGGCAAVPEDTTPPSTPIEQTEPSTPIEQTEPSIPKIDYPVPPETLPPTGTDSTEPPPAIGPEGLPTPAL